jgi:hypothetical protein
MRRAVATKESPRGTTGGAKLVCAAAPGTRPHDVLTFDFEHTIEAPGRRLAVAEKTGQ